MSAGTLTSQTSPALFVPADADTLRIDTTPTGPTASVCTRDGRWIRLHSGRDPVAEAERAVAPLLAGGAPPVLILIGLGLGYVLDALERQAPAVRVLALEPLPAVARALRARPTAQAWLASKRLTLLTGPEYDMSGEAWRVLGPHVEAPLIVAPVLEREFGPEVARAVEVVSHLRFGARANAEARRKFAPRYLLNTLRNIPVIARSADVSALAGAFTGVPAVVVAAGPSLDRNLEDLRQAQGRALLIAVDTALRPLLEAGIEPDLVVAVDPSELNARHLRHLPDTRHTWLVGEASLNPTAFEAFRGRTFTFAVSDHQPWPWLRSVGLDRGRLRAWGSVLTSAFDLSLYAGCNPIVFAGADLAYTGRQPYCRGTVYEHDWAARAACGERLAEIWESVTAAKGTLSLNDVLGQPVVSSPSLLAFRDWLVTESAAHDDRRFINATGGGVLAGGRFSQGRVSDVLTAALDDAGRVRAAVQAAWLAGRRTPGPDLRALAQALSALAASGAQASPLSDWLEFAGREVQHEAVQRALADSVRRLEQADQDEASASPHILLAHGAPERAWAIHCAIAGRPAGVSVAIPSGDERPSPGIDPAALTRASRLLTSLLRDPAPLCHEDPAVLRLELSVAPASRSCDWQADAMPRVLDYEAALAAALTVEAGGAGSLVPGVSLETAGVLRPPAATDPCPADTAARLGLLADWLSVVAAVEHESRGLVRTGGAHALPLRVAASVVRAYQEALGPPACATDETDAAAMASGTAIITLAERHVTIACTPNRRRAAEALTGALTWVGEAGDPSLAHLSLPAMSIALRAQPDDAEVHVAMSMHPVGIQPSSQTGGVGPLPTKGVGESLEWILPVRLNPPSPGCMIGHTLDETHARFTLVNGTRSLRIDAAGHWALDAEWPGPLVGEVRWGATGGVAWHNAETSRVMWRDRPDGRVSTVVMPFTACLAFPQTDGSIWWTAFDGGVWSWTPGGSWRRLVETPPVMGLQTHADGVYLHPAGGDSTFRARPSLEFACRWSPASGAVDPVPLGDEGPCWSTAERNGWTALAYPHGDQVRLRHHEGAQYVLTCADPFNLAWAGPSLVVSTGRSELLVFRELLSCLEP